MWALPPCTNGQLAGYDLRFYRTNPDSVTPVSNRSDEIFRIVKETDVPSNQRGSTYVQVSTTILVAEQEARWLIMLLCSLHVYCMCNIESVDSICRDSVDTQYYMLIQTNFSKSPKQLTYKPLLHPTVHLRVFSWRKTHPGGLAIKHRESTEPESHPTVKLFFVMKTLEDER